jgi:hypothetical protein
MSHIFPKQTVEVVLKKGNKITAPFKKGQFFTCADRKWKHDVYMHENRDYYRFGKIHVLLGRILSHFFDKLGSFL